MFKEHILINEKPPFLLDTFIQGSYENEKLLENFLYHIFFEDKLNEKIYNIQFFQDEINGNENIIENYLPLKSIPKNFNNKKNTFLDKEEKYFQINITFNVKNEQSLKEINSFFSSFYILLENEDSELYFFYRKDFKYLKKFILKKNLVIKVDKLSKFNNKKYIEKQKKHFILNTI